MYPRWQDGQQPKATSHTTYSVNYSLHFLPRRGEKRRELPRRDFTSLLTQERRGEERHEERLHEKHASCNITWHLAPGLRSVRLIRTNHILLHLGCQPYNFRVHCVRSFSLYHTVNLLMHDVGPADESSHPKDNGRKAHCILQWTYCMDFWWKYLWKWLVGPQTAAQSYLFWWKYLWKWLVGSQSQTAATEPSPCYLSWWKYLWEWLVGLRQSQTAATEPSPCNLLCWKYLWKWLFSPLH